MLASTLVALAVLTVRSRFNDPDLWWHLRTGQIIWTNRAIPRTDLLSFTTGQHAWVPHEWLSQLSMYAAWRAGDYSGLMLWFCIATAALLVIQYASCSLYSGNAKVAFLGALVTWFFSTVGLAIRPQLLGFTFLVCELLILHLGRSRDRRWFYLLPFLVCRVGEHPRLFLLRVDRAGGGARHVDSFKVTAGLLISRPLDPAQRKTLLWAAALSVVALFVNPVGWPLLAYPLRTIFDQRMQLDAVTEWQKLSFDDVRAFGLLALAGAILLIALVRRTVLYVDEVALLAVAFGMAVLHQRLLFAWGIVAAPIHLPANCGNVGSSPIRLATKSCRTRFSFSHRWRLRFSLSRSQSALASQVRRGNPVEAVDFIRRTHLTGRNAQRIRVRRLFDLGASGAEGVYRRPGRCVRLDRRL